MISRVVDEEVTLVKYYPNYKTALEWYQDLDVCKQVDNRDTVYDLPLLKAMYNYLNQHGDLFYIKYRNRLHKLASGATVENLDVVKNIINDLEQLLED